MNYISFLSYSTDLKVVCPILILLVINYRFLKAHTPTWTYGYLIINVKNLMLSLNSSHVLWGK